MRSLSATEAARHFSEVLDAVEASGETFIVLRRGRAIARIEAAGGRQGQAVKELLGRAPRDTKWAEDLGRTRAMTQPQDRRWSG
jgi:antitoxin (DNA-binding transcriptional repressor) of toxin-antitoxin stability system